MDLPTIWFVLIAVLWAGYFLLEGFDFGVGILLPVLGRDDDRRRIIIHTVAPVWDGNEVWLLVAGGATFAAFPEWYASLFAGFFLPLLVIMLALIVRGVAFEYRSKKEDPQWRRRWDACLFFGSLIPAVLWGVAFGNVARGVPLNAEHHYIGSFWELLNPYALLGGLTTLALFTLHGAVFLALKTGDDLRERARRLAAQLVPVTVVLAGGFLLWTQLTHGDDAGRVCFAVAAVALVATLPAIRAGREGRAFLATGLTILAVTAGLFVTLYPHVLPASNVAAHGLTIENASSTPYTLRIMTWIAVAATPLVLLYEAWSYWVFRQRLRVHQLTAPATGE